MQACLCIFFQVNAIPVNEDKNTYTNMNNKVWHSDFKVKLICTCLGFFKSNVPYLDTSYRVLTVFEVDQLIYFIML